MGAGGCQRPHDRSLSEAWPSSSTSHGYREIFLLYKEDSSGNMMTNGNDHPISVLGDIGGTNEGDWSLQGSSRGAAVLRPCWAIRRNCRPSFVTSVSFSGGSRFFFFFFQGNLKFFITLKQ